jgi:hypothetical protein
MSADLVTNRITPQTQLSSFGTLSKKERLTFFSEGESQKPITIPEAVLTFTSKNMASAQE